MWDCLSFLIGLLTQRKIWWGIGKDTLSAPAPGPEPGSSQGANPPSSSPVSPAHICPFPAHLSPSSSHLSLTITPSVLHPTNMVVASWYQVPDGTPGEGMSHAHFRSSSSTKTTRHTQIAQGHAHIRTVPQSISYFT